MTIEEIKQVAEEQKINITFEMGFINIISKCKNGGFSIPFTVIEKMTLEDGKLFLFSLIG